MFRCWNDVETNIPDQDPDEDRIPDYGGGTGMQLHEEDNCLKFTFWLINNVFDVKYEVESE